MTIEIPEVQWHQSIYADDFEALNKQQFDDEYIRLGYIDTNPYITYIYARDHGGWREFCKRPEQLTIPSEDEVTEAMKEKRHLWRGFSCDQEDGACPETPDKVFAAGFEAAVRWLVHERKEI